MDNTTPLLQALRQAIRDECGTFQEAGDRLELSADKVRKLLRGTHSLSADELCRITDVLGIDIHAVLEASGRYPTIQSWNVLEHLTVSTLPDPAFSRLFDRMMSRLSTTPPSSGYLVEPSDAFFSTEALHRLSKDKFRNSVAVRRRDFLPVALRKHKYSPEWVRHFAEILDLSARACVENLPKSAAILGLALRLPLDPSSLTRLYLEELGCFLLRRADAFALSIERTYSLLGRAYIADELLATRALLMLASTQALIGQDDRAQSALQKAYELGPNTEFGYFAAFNRAQYCAKRGEFATARTLLTHLMDTPNPKLHFSALWLSGKIRLLEGDMPVARSLLSSALSYRPEDQDPLNLILIFDDLKECMPRRFLIDRFRELSPLLRTVSSPQARRAAKALLELLQNSDTQTFTDSVASLVESS